MLLSYTLNVSEENGIIKISYFRGFKTLQRAISIYYSNRIGNNIIDVKRWSLSFESFYAIEFIYILQQLLNYKHKRGKPRLVINKSEINTIIEQMYKKTWVGRTLGDNYKQYQTEFIDSSKVDRLRYKLDNIQRNFVYDVYCQEKARYQLDGYLLAFDPGVGKTFTSLALFAGIGIEKTIILCQGTALDNTWEREIETVYPTEQKIWSVSHGKPLSTDYDFFLCTYQSISKLFEICPELRKYKVGIIVDECHYFKNDKSLRSEELAILKQKTETTNLLLMSGTPIKGMVKEILPILDSLDPLFTKPVKERYTYAFGYTSNIGLDIVNHRLGLVMLRKTNAHLNLPNKITKTLMIKVPNGKRFTLEEVRKVVSAYVEDREVFYNDNVKFYRDNYKNALMLFEESIKTEQEKALYKQYQNDVKDIIKYGTLDPSMKEIIIRANKYEKFIATYLGTLENGRLIKQQFIEAKTVIKYVHLKIMGEVLGNILPKLREEMTIAMVDSCDLVGLISEAEKKTICFTSFTNVAKFTYDRLNKLNLTDIKPVMVIGETAKTSKDDVTSFLTEPDVNPLVTTYAMLGVSVTMVEANQVLILNQPWRKADLDQAVARALRKGQDTDVTVINFQLDTGVEPNLSTRMMDILNWSRDMFGAIVDGEFENELHRINLDGLKREGGAKKFIQGINLYRKGVVESIDSRDLINDVKINKPIFL